MSAEGIERKLFTPSVGRYVAYTFARRTECGALSYAGEPLGEEKGDPAKAMKQYFKLYTQPTSLKRSIFTILPRRLALPILPPTQTPLLFLFTLIFIFFNFQFILSSPPPLPIQLSLYLSSIFQRITVNCKP